MKQGKSDITKDKDSLIKFDLKSFLESYTEKDILRLKKLFPDNYILLSEQLKLYPKAKIKLPIFTEKYCWLTTKSYEQSSSEALAVYKAAMFKGNVMLDLTGGLGVDDWAFSRAFKKVVSIDNNAGLNELVKINFDKLGIKNIERITADSKEYIKNELSADLIYIDADRRTKNKRSIILEHAEPPVLQMLTRIFELTENVLLKLSPLTDITYLKNSLSKVKIIYVISYENEVKEILVHLNKSYSTAAAIKAVDISKSGTREYLSTENRNDHPEQSTSGKYFYEPAASIIKAGLTNNLALLNKLYTISKNGIYLLSDAQINDFFGRSFEIIHQMEFSRSASKKYLKQNSIAKANVSKRDFPLTVDEIKKLFSLQDGGDEYLFFTQTSAKYKLMYHCRKISSKNKAQLRSCAQGYIEE